jgi:transketolase
MRDTFVKTLLEIAKNDQNVILITGDLGFGVLKPFWDELPDQIINVGIAEQNMTGFATGLALEGKIVFAYSIGNFPTLRTLEQIRNDAAYHNANVKIVSVGGGFAYGALGMSHHATEDIAIMRALPNVKVFVPSDLSEAEVLTKVIYEEPGVCYLRLGRGGEKKIHLENPIIEIGKPIKIIGGKDIVIFITGTIFEEVSIAIQHLKEKNIFPTVYTFPTVKPLNKSELEKIVKNYRYLFTIEEHNLNGGFGSAILEGLSGFDFKNLKVTLIGLKDLYSSAVGSQQFLRNFYGIDHHGIINQIEKTING